MGDADEQGAAALPGPPAARGTLLVVFTTILIDFIGFTVLIPVLPLFAERLGATGFEIALITTLYALAQLIFLPAWGWVSDRVGRRPVILVSLFGTAGSFVVLAFAETMATVYLARVLGGFFAASIGTAQAVVTDVTSPAERARGMGVIGAAFGAGVVVGPAIGGFTSQWGEQATFYTVAALALATFAVAWRFLPESRPSRLRKPGLAELRQSLVPTPLRLISAVHDRRIALFLYLFFHIFSAFAVLEALITLYAGKRFDRSALEVGYMFVWIGAVIFLTQGVLLRRLVVWLGETRLVAIGLVAMAAGLTWIPFLSSFGWLYPAGTLIAFGVGTAFPTFTSLYSKACQAENAGELLGQSQAMATAGRIVGPALGGLAMDELWLGAPFLIAGGMMLAALVLFEVFRGVLVGGPHRSNDSRSHGADPSPGESG